MLSKDITYTYKDDETKENVTETKTFWFNIGKLDVIRLEARWSKVGGIRGRMTEIIESKDNEVILEFFEELVSSSYGIKNGPDHKKNAEIREQFMSSAAYEELVVQLLTAEDSASYLGEFITGIFPDDVNTPEMQLAIQQEIKKQAAENEAVNTATSP